MYSICDTFLKFHIGLAEGEWQAGKILKLWEADYHTVGLGVFMGFVDRKKKKKY